MAELGKKLESYDQDPYFLFNPERGDMRQADRNSSINQITTYIYQSMLDFQGKWYPTDRGVWTIDMPNARYLAPGDKITNVTTGQIYRIAELLTPQDSIPNPHGNIIRLDNLIVGAIHPQSGDILALEEKNTVNFQTAYSRYYQERPIAEWRDTVIFRLKRREPGTVGKHPFDAPTEIKPRVREYRVDPDHPDAHIMVLGQWFDNLIQFDCWSKYNNRVDDLVEWFEDFMYKYTWVWKKNGVNEILYWMRTIDEESSKWRNDLAVRSVLYYFRTEKIVTIREYDFKQIDMILSLDNALPSGFYGVRFGNVPFPSGNMQVLDKSFRAYV